MIHEIYKKPIRMGSVLKFTLPTSVMTLVQSLYSMVDGIFVANLIGESALSALTLISPYFNILTAVAAMFASGGSAVVMKKMGEGRHTEACEDFTMLMLCNLLIGGIFTITGTVFAGQLSGVFHASAEVSLYCKEYLFSYMFFAVFHLLFSNLEMYVIASGGSGLAMFSSIFGGIFNILFDYLLIKVFSMGMKGAAIASGMGMMIPCLTMTVYFMRKKHMLHFAMPGFRPGILLKTASNGFSEFSGNLVSGVVMLIFNQCMLRYAGEAGVAASTIIFYVFGFMSALYMGYMFGVSPLLSYFYGGNSREKLRKLRNISLFFIGLVAAVTTICAVAGSESLVGIFAHPGTEAYLLAIRGNKLFSAALLLVGFNTFSSMLFTALSNGLISAVISFSRTFLFLVGAVVTLPVLWGLDGLWLAVPVSELMAAVLSFFFFEKYKKKYGY